MGSVVLSSGDAMKNPLPAKEMEALRKVVEGQTQWKSHPNMSDTLIACCGSLGYMLPYMRGEYAPHYPVPAIPYQIDYCECDLGYIYIDNPNDSSRYVAVFIR